MIAVVLVEYPSPSHWKLRWETNEYPFWVERWKFPVKSVLGGSGKGGCRYVLSGYDETTCTTVVSDSVWPMNFFINKSKKNTFNSHHFFNSLTKTDFTPLKINMSPKKGPFNRKYIFEPLIFRGHASFRGCILWDSKQWNGWKSPFPSIYKWLFGVPGYFGCFETPRCWETLRRRMRAGNGSLQHFQTVFLLKPGSQYFAMFFFQGVHWNTRQQWIFRVLRFECPMWKFPVVVFLHTSAKRKPQRLRGFEALSLLRSSRIRSSFGGMKWWRSAKTKNRLRRTRLMRMPERPERLKLPRSCESQELHN